MDIALLIIGMAIVSYIPRALPAVLLDRVNFSPKIEKFLSLIPYTAMAALIFPGVLSVDTQLWYVGIFGAVVAGGLAWKKVPMAANIIFTVLALVVLYLFIGSI